LVIETSGATVTKASAEERPEEQGQPNVTDSERVAHRRALLAVFGTVPLAAACFWWFRNEGWLADTPFWILLVLLVGTGIMNFASVLWLKRAPHDQARIQVRLCVSMLATTSIVYAVGWGPMLVIGYGVGFAIVLQEAGSASWRSGFAWSVVAVGLGQLAIELQIAPTLIDEGLGNALALGGLICFGVVARVLGVQAVAVEEAERELTVRGEQFRALLQHAVDVIAVVDRKGCVLFASPAVHGLLGYTPAEIEGQSIEELVPEFELERLQARIANVADHPGFSQSISSLQLRHSDGTVRWSDTTITNPSGEWTDSVVLNVHDITKQRELEEQLRHDALHDPLTGLWNRPAFSQYAEKACLRAARESFTLALLFVDLDGFKQVNDTLGHGLGDEVLVQVGRRLRSCLRGTEVLARLGGDEFTVLIERVSGAGDAIDIADRIHDTLTRPFEGPEGPLYLGASVGIALSENGRLSAAELLRDADHAMYSAKRSGRSGWKLADPGSTPSPVPAH
jgi:diguanylate cyclase (GGDEF)-like protein/PAS domain S-box-containing protein